MTADTSPVRILFVTHSITEDNERGVATGWLPGKLSSRGRRLARRIGTRYPRETFAAVFSSDLARAIETVELAYGAVASYVADSRLRECNYGDLNGAPVSVVAALRSRHIETAFPGGESFLDVCGRMRAFLKDVREFRGSHILVVGHSATRWSLEHLVHGVPWRELVDADFEWKEGWEYELDSVSSEPKNS